MKRPNSKKTFLNRSCQTSAQEKTAPSRRQIITPVLSANEMLAAGYFSFPKPSTINVYRELSDLVFTSHDSHIDLHDVLMANAKSDCVYCFYVGISTTNSNWDYWTEVNKQKIEHRIRYLFEFENIDITIDRLFDINDALCFEEFLWKIEFTLS